MYLLSHDHKFDGSMWWIEYEAVKVSFD